MKKEQKGTVETPKDFVVLADWEKEQQRLRKEQNRLNFKIMLERFHMLKTTSKN